MYLWKQTQSFGLANHKMTGICWWIYVDCFAFSLLLKRMFFSPKSEAQSLICFGPLEEVDELCVLYEGKQEQIFTLFI